MIQVMHTVADYVHDAKYKMPDRPLPCFIKDFFQNTAFVLARHQKTGMPGSIKTVPSMHIRTVLL